MIDCRTIKNGDRDAVALVDGTGIVLDFISYEGTRIYHGGPANGLRARDIDVYESSTTAVGHSLQLTGVGCTRDAFTWVDPRVHTPGTANLGQTFDCPGHTPKIQERALEEPIKVPNVLHIPVEEDTSIDLDTKLRIPETHGRSGGKSSTARVKVMTYNIRESGQRTFAWKDVIKEENADIIVFTEVGNWDDNNNQLLKEYVKEFNSYFPGEKPYLGDTARGIPLAFSSNAILTRFPIVQKFQLKDKDLGTNLAHDIMVWKLNVGKGDNYVYVIGIHLKCCGGDNNNDRRVDNMKKLLEWIDANIARSNGILMMGDFNSVSPVDTDPSFPGYANGFAPGPGSNLKDGPIRMLLDPTEPFASQVHTFRDAFRQANPTCNVESKCCGAEHPCSSRLSAHLCPERGYTYVDSSRNMQSRIDYIILNQHIPLSGPSTVGDKGKDVCSASDHVPVDVIVSFDKLREA